MKAATLKKDIIVVDNLVKKFGDFTAVDGIFFFGTYGTRYLESVDQWSRQDYYSRIIETLQTRL